MNHGILRSLNWRKGNLLESRPFFSIITACLNRADFIETAIQSVLAQNFDDFEHIIIDGGSTDGTLELLKKYPHLRVFSGPDSGVYDAFNKGITRARGEVLTFLNSDDRWGFGFLPAVADAFRRDAGLEVVTTNAAVYEIGQNNEWKYIKGLPALAGGEKFFQNMHGRGPAINAWFIHRKLIERIGQFNSGYKISADLEFCLRAIIHNAFVQALDVEVYNYLTHPDSLTFHNDPEKRSLSILENFQILEYYLKQKELKQYQVKYFINWYKNLAIREMKRGVRLIQPLRFIHALDRYFKIFRL
jgi:glycosyltransferase involved in cell wall biosynthesis